ncbi:K-homology type RNA binding protein [Handroanthus impetiginosus]|uniref:K-homology type RNA binding protein n=1 Tax=Handroanthus impetiginosus TaxID=429701 RepID=A0A2G9HXV2_9LAMI|nr:K-homology type RNA binding protein [Handroanthus impetiginosus]
MADEKVMASPEGSPIATYAGDGHKRKLEDLELNNAPEPPKESEPSANRDSLNNGAQQEDENRGADESETKRPRLEGNGDNVSEADGQASQNGHQEEVKEDEPKEEEKEDQPREEKEDEHIEEVKEYEPREKEKEDEPKVEESKQPESADDNGQLVEGQEPIETTPKEPTSNENVKSEIGNADEVGQSEAEGDGPSELPREGDVPIYSAEQQPGSDTQILSRKMEVPNDKVGVLIGKAGDTIRSLQDNSGAKIQILRDADADPRAASRPLELVGTLASINKAEKLIKDVIAEADAGGSPSLVARGFSTVQAASGGEQLEMQVPIEKVGLIIGKGGETIRNLQTRSGARIQLIQQSQSDGDQSRERTVRITGSKKQIETAREMIKDVMNQIVRPSPLSSGYNQQGYRPRGPAAPQWGPRGPHHGQYSGYDYPQRGPYPSQNSQYPPPSYGNYPPPQAPRSNYGPSWEQRPPASMHGPSHQGNYNYGQQQGPDYGHPPPYSQPPPQPYSHGYNEVKYDHHPPSQHYGHMGSQPTPYAQGGTHMGYGPPDQYSKPPMYGMQPQAPHSQPYGQPRPSQPVEVPYQGSGPSAQPYGQSMPAQQSYPYASSGPMQQSYAPYGSAPTSDGYGHNPATAPASGYAPQGGQPVAGYSQPGAQQPPAYPQAGPAGGYSSYPTAQPGYAEQAAASNATYGYQAPADPTYGGTQGAAAYPAAAAGQSGYAQPAQTQPGYDQSGGYGNVAAQAGYGKSVSPQPTAYPQYDSSQMYGAHR